MANHKSAKKRIRETQVRNLHNRYYAKTARNAMRRLRATTVKDEAAELYKKVSSMLDKLAKKNVIHANNPYVILCKGTTNFSLSLMCDNFIDLPYIFSKITSHSKNPRIIHKYFVFL